MAPSARLPCRNLSLTPLALLFYFCACGWNAASAPFDQQDGPAGLPTRRVEHAYATTEGSVA